MSKKLSPTQNLIWSHCLFLFSSIYLVIIFAIWFEQIFVFSLYICCQQIVEILNWCFGENLWLHNRQEKHPRCQTCSPAFITFSNEFVCWYICICVGRSSLRNLCICIYICRFFIFQILDAKHAYPFHHLLQWICVLMYLYFVYFVYLKS